MERKIKISQLPQVSAQAEAIKPKYRKLEGKSGRTWLVPIERFAGDNVHVSGRKESQGYGGSTLTFTLEDGSTIDLKGPWHSNAGNLYEDTGLDIRDKHATRVFIAEAIEYVEGDYYPMLSGILHEDLDFQEGSFDRGTDIAKDFANKLNKPVYYYVQTGGGSHSGWQKPEEK